MHPAIGLMLSILGLFIVARLIVWWFVRNIGDID